MKRLTNEPQIILLSVPHNGRCFVYEDRMNEFGKNRREILLSEIKELEKDHTIIQLIRAEGSVSSDVRTSEEEIVE
jgi:hypothetical protein